MIYEMRYVETYAPNGENYGEYEFNDGNGSRFVFGQIWDDEEYGRDYGFYGLV